MSNDYTFREEYKDLVPNGIYKAQSIRYEEHFTFSKAKKLYLRFKILDHGEHYGKKVFMAFNISGKGRIRQGSKYFKTWVQVNNWQRPSRNAKMSPRLFKNKIFKVRTRICKPEHNGAEMPRDFWYSVVDSIVEVMV